MTKTFDWAFPFTGTDGADGLFAKVNVSDSVAASDERVATRQKATDGVNQWRAPTTGTETNTCLED